MLGGGHGEDVASGCFGIVIERNTIERLQPVTVGREVDDNLYLDDKVRPMFGRMHAARSDGLPFLNMVMPHRM